MEEIENMNRGETPARPITLSILCVLTFIFSGLGILTSVLTPLFSDVMIEQMMRNPEFDEEAMADTLKALQAGWGYYILTFVLTTGSLIGAILMWKLKKNGFHFYAFSNLAMLFVPTLVLGLAISWTAIIITVSFILMYALHLKFMK